MLPKHQIGAAVGDEEGQNPSPSVTTEGDCCATEGVSARDGCDFSVRC